MCCPAFPSSSFFASRSRFNKGTTRLVRPTKFRISFSTHLHRLVPPHIAISVSFPRRPTLPSLFRKHGRIYRPRNGPSMKRWRGRTKPASRLKRHRTTALGRSRPNSKRTKGTRICLAGPCRPSCHTPTFTVPRPRKSTPK